MKLVKFLLAGIGLMAIIGTVIYFVRLLTRDPKDLNSYPIVENCYKDRNVRKSNSKPTADEVERIQRRMDLFTNMKLRLGYFIVRERSVRGFPGLEQCDSWFIPRIANRQGVTISGDEYKEAFVVDDEDLENMAEIIYGKPKDKYFSDTYYKWIKQPKCTEKLITCLMSSSAYPEIDDGEIRQNEYGKKILYRYIIEATGGNTSGLYLLNLTTENGWFKSARSDQELILEYREPRIIY